MTNSKTIAALIGPSLIAMAVSAANSNTAAALIEQGSRDPALIYVTGILMFVAGLAIVRAHNRWVAAWPVLVTVLGWLALIGGLCRMLFPIQLGEAAAKVGQRTGVTLGAAAVLFAAGAFLSFQAYRRE
jgi:uncharacterized membrane protein HdeD (DUF308 family)